jgi:hypothetical protein
MPRSTSRRTGGRPTLRRSSSFSSATRMFSASSSSTSRSSLRVTRKVSSQQIHAGEQGVPSWWPMIVLERKEAAVGQA